MSETRRFITTMIREQRILSATVLGSGAVALIALVGVFVDDRVLTGAAIWLKAFKFGVSIAAYGATMMWMVSLLGRGRRWGMRLGALSGLMLIGELAIITLQIIRGTTSHFNEQTSFDEALWRAMGGLIIVLWLANLVIAVIVVRQRLEAGTLPAGVGLGIKLGIIMALIGMAIAFRMTIPTEAQVVADEAGTGGILGAHSVGVPDGGPGMAVTGWSLTGGDLRIPHFLGLHALQAIPLFALLLALPAARRGRLARPSVRVGLTWVFAATYAGVLAITTWQALRGQSLVRPDSWTLLAFGGLIAGASAGTLAVLTPRPVREEAPTP